MAIFDEFKDESLQKRHYLYFNEQTVFTEADFAVSGLILEESVNPDEDFTLGGTCCACLKFELKNYGGLVADLAGKEFTYFSGVQTGRAEYDRIAKTARSTVICLHGNAVYAGYEKEPYLRTWRIEESGALTRLEDPEQPAHPVGAILIIGEKLYCCHSQAPFLTAYGLPGMNKENSPGLSALAVHKIQWFIEHKTCLNKQEDIIREYTVDTYNMQPVNLVETVFEYMQVGIFNAEPEQKNETQIAVTAYDRMTKFDVIVDEMLNSLSYPVIVNKLFISLCNFCGVTPGWVGMCNYTFPVKKNFEISGVTGRQALRWIGEITAQFARISSTGSVDLDTFMSIDYELTENDVTELVVSEYKTTPIEKLQVKVTENDIGVIVGTGTNTYVIENNPFFYAESDAQLRPYVQAVFDKIKDISYFPYSIKNLHGNPYVRAGRTLRIRRRSGEIIRALVMNHTMKCLPGIYDEYSATGNRTRAVQNSGANLQVQQVKGMVHEVINTVDTLNSTIQDVRGDQSTIEQTVNGIRTTVSQNKTDADGKISQLQTSITQNANAIQLRVEKGSVVSQINQSAESIKIQANKIDIDGYLTAGNASFCSKKGNRSIELRNGEILFKRGSSVIGEIWSHTSMNVFGIEFTDSLWFNKTDGDPANETSHGVCGITNDGFNVNGNLTASGSKNSVQKTEHYGNRLINAYETAEYFFGDIGEDTVLHGTVTVFLDAIFLECVNTEVPYQVFLTPYGNGHIYVSKRCPDYFIVCGDDIPFGWEIKAKRRGYENCRLEVTV